MQLTTVNANPDGEEYQQQHGRAYNDDRAKIAQKKNQINKIQNKF
jgi:hypothetical protein